jgi:hypothetical protein
LRPERDADPSPLSSAEVKNRVELYLALPKGLRGLWKVENYLIHSVYKCWMLSSKEFGSYWCGVFEVRFCPWLGVTEEEKGNPSVRRAPWPWQIWNWNHPNTNLRHSCSIGLMEFLWFLMIILSSFTEICSLEMNCSTLV